MTEQADKLTPEELKQLLKSTTIDNAIKNLESGYTNTDDYCRYQSFNHVNQIAVKLIQSDGYKKGMVQLGGKKMRYLKYNRQKDKTVTTNSVDYKVYSWKPDKIKLVNIDDQDIANENFFPLLQQLQKETGLVHGDLRRDNIMKKDDTYYLIDPWSSLHTQVDSMGPVIAGSIESFHLQETLNRKLADLKKIDELEAKILGIDGGTYYVHTLDEFFLDSEKKIVKKSYFSYLNQIDNITAPVPGSLRQLQKRYSGYVIDTRDPTFLQKYMVIKWANTYELTTFKIPNISRQRLLILQATLDTFLNNKVDESKESSGNRHASKDDEPSAKKRSNNKPSVSFTGGGGGQTEGTNNNNKKVESKKSSGNGSASNDDGPSAKKRSNNKPSVSSKGGGGKQTEGTNNNNKEDESKKISGKRSANEDTGQLAKIGSGESVSVTWYDVVQQIDELDRGLVDAQTQLNTIINQMQDGSVLDQVKSFRNEIKSIPRYLPKTSQPGRVKVWTDLKKLYDSKYRNWVCKWDQIVKNGHFDVRVSDTNKAGLLIQSAVCMIYNLLTIRHQQVTQKEVYALIPLEEMSDLFTADAC
jgi:hypothetical protein